MMQFIRPFTKPALFQPLFGRSHKYAFNNLNKLHEQSSKLAHLLLQHQAIRIWSLEQLQKSSNHTLISQSKDQGRTNIVVNKYFSTIAEIPPNLQNVNIERKGDLQEKSKYKNLIKTVNQSSNWVFLPNFYNIFRRNTQTNNKPFILLIGDYHEYFMSLHDQNLCSFITLEEFCAMFPEKVPLSYRSRQNIQNIKKNIEARLINSQSINTNKLDQEPKFSEIIICNDKIKMWDEAYQIMLDELPCKITVPFHCAQKSQDFYKLNLEDFIEGFKTSHKIIHPNIPLEIDHQNCYSLLKEVFQTLHENSHHKLRNDYSIEFMDDEMIVGNQGKSLSSQALVAYLMGNQ